MQSSKKKNPLASKLVRDQSRTNKQKIIIFRTGSRQINHWLEAMKLAASETIFIY